MYKVIKREFDPKIASIVAESLTLKERLSLTLTFDPVDNIKIEERLKQWCQVVAQGDMATFEKRLAWAGLSIEKIQPLLVDRDRDEISQLPAWATTLRQIVKQAQNSTREHRFAPQRYLNLEAVPFEQIYLPCLQVARKKLLDRIGDYPDRLTEAVRGLLERQLLLQLNNLGFPTLMEEFSAFRSLGDSACDFILFNLIGSSANSVDCREKYDAFVDRLFTDGLLSLFEKYPVLGRLLATAIDLWVEATEEFCDRLTANWSQIEERFSPQQPLKQITELKTGLSDPHNGCRTVIILTFDTGMKLVYKPKDIGIDVAFSELLMWLNRQNELLPFKVLQVLNYGTHGWIEYAEQLPCSDLSAVKRFYQRAGILLCLVYLLKGIDCHGENVVASGEHLVLIDIETLFHHRTEHYNPSDVNATELAVIQLNQSVWLNLMLPKWGISPEDSLTVDVSALGGTDERELIVSKVQKINTDRMHVGTESYVATKQNVPQMGEECFEARNYLPEIVEGFKQMYDFTIGHRELLLSSDSPLTNFATQKVRYVFRATRIYHTILNNSLAPDFLKSGIDRSIKLDILSRAFLVGDKKPHYWSILDAELQAMETLDIPFFSPNTNRVSLELTTGATVSEMFAESSFTAVISRLESLSEQDLARQIEIIRGSFCARFITEPCFNSQAKDSVPLLPKSTALTSEQLVHEAIAIAQELQQQGFYDGDRVSWIGLGLRPNAPGFQLRGLSNNFYYGTSGIALFLAALAKVTKSLKWHDLALRTLQPLRERIQSFAPEIEVFTKPELRQTGRTKDMSSIAYALVQISQFLGDTSLLKDAKKVANLIATEPIQGDRVFNLMDGSAGNILASLKLYEIEPSALKIAIACGEQVLEHQDSLGKDLQAGFAYGAAGIAYALLRLFEVTQNARFLEGAKTIIAHEQNWQKAHSKELVSYNSWANGAAGIGLGRLGGLSSLNSEAIRQEIERHLIATQQYCLEDIDNLAWGNLGRIETLLVASQKLNRPELFDFGLQATTVLVKRAKERKRFNLVAASVPPAYNPGFLQGTTGIGYQLLRIAYPDLLPSILLWQ